MPSRLTFRQHARKLHHDLRQRSHLRRPHPPLLTRPTPRHQLTTCNNPAKPVTIQTLGAPNNLLMDASASTVPLPVCLFVLHIQIPDTPTHHKPHARDP